MCQTPTKHNLVAIAPSIDIYRQQVRQVDAWDRNSDTWLQVKYTNEQHCTMHIPVFMKVIVIISDAHAAMLMDINGYLGNAPPHMVRLQY